MKVLIISPDYIGEKMAGPGIRYWNLAKYLSQQYKVTLLIPNSPDDAENLSKDKNIAIAELNSGNVKYFLKVNDIVLTQGAAISRYKELRKKQIPVIVDLYDPFILECLQLRKSKFSAINKWLYGMDLGMLLDQIQYGDYFICANEKQKDFWFGMLCGTGKVNPEYYQSVRESSKIIGIVPFGIEPELPAKQKNVLKGVQDGISANDKVLIWAGGIWEWMDPATLISAMDILAKRQYDNIKCYFMGTKRPGNNPNVTNAAEKAIELSNEFGLTNKNIFFGEWTGYNERHEYLLESDIGVTTYFNNFETEYSFRTRVLDYLWTKKPFIVTEGDYFAKLAIDSHIGLTVKENDPDDLADKIALLLNDRELYAKLQSNMENVSNKFYWHNIIQSLSENMAGIKINNSYNYSPLGLAFYKKVKRNSENIKPLIYNLFLKK